MLFISIKFPSLTPHQGIYLGPTLKRCHSGPILSRRYQSSKLIILLRIRYQMEDSLNLTLIKKISNSLSHLKLNSDKLDQVTAHCRQDHISSNHLDGRKNRSCYRTTFSPPKMFPDYNRPIAQRELEQFRKNESSSHYLPSISNSSQYQNSFKHNNQQRVTRSKEKQSWFLKGDWAMKPASDYQENFSKKNGNQVNKTNHLRSNYSTLTTLQLKQGQKGVSIYGKDYKAYFIKKQNKLTIGNKDHLNGKENSNIQTGLSEYQRRYDSVFVSNQPKHMNVSLFSKGNLIKRTASNKNH